MLFKLFAVAALSVAAYGMPSSSPVGCRSEPTAEFLELTKRMALDEKENGGLSKRASSSIHVDVFFHVIAASNYAQDGYLSTQQINDQVNVMNQRFAPYNIQFTLRGTDWTVNSNWAYGYNNYAMQSSLRKGDYKTLNLYTMQTVYPQDTETTGFCNLPVQNPSQSAFISDGCFLTTRTMPGGNSPLQHLGLTAVHEIGHWFGLLHTFTGNSCTGSGDYVDDTPAQASATYGCVQSRDSCPNQPGSDPIHNYMDYTCDDLRNEFTRGQVARIYSFWDSCRA
ncbi:hypothetical protein JX265_001703 [Neoarthrinium moseri]|uniref:Peptidase M43 pregnancy-associated plasma-A domain-containing protein n=1 Tax=Neoarthrinium moseri TaxID=1658444 RepID=A0A9Q0AU26_9PEZI|nr:hypothetical protein JX265_001703 [Neoarthrinium moseri]